MDRKLDQANETFTKAIKIDPKYADAYNRRGAVYSDAMKLDLAIADFTKAIELNPKLEIPYLNRGTIYLMYKKDYKSALENFNKMLELSPDNWMGFMFRAMAYEKMGEKALADADNKKVKELMDKEKQKINPNQK
ncbi:MAG: tetratricopeptide repeat protein [Pyrinomonadaceae bacterium]|nr:tetratricopeptide repeat protein [Pyrinomonadaceae bacterium]